MKTPRFLKEKALGYANEIRIGEIGAGKHGVFKMFLKELEYYTGYDYIPGGSTLRNATANTAVINHAKKTFALHERNLPFGVKLTK